MLLPRFSRHVLPPATATSGAVSSIRIMSDPLRFFVPSESLQEDQVVITGEPYHHLRNVLRIKAGAVILLLDGHGQCCEVELQQLQPERPQLRRHHARP